MHHPRSFNSIDTFDHHTSLRRFWYLLAYHHPPHQFLQNMEYHRAQLYQQCCVQFTCREPRSWNTAPVQTIPNYTCPLGLESMTHLNSCLAELQELMNVSLQKLNLERTKVLLIRGQRLTPKCVHPTPLSLGNTTLNSSDHVLCLGVIDEELSLRNQISAFVQ